jgi:hypothetical protein
MCPPAPGRPEKGDRRHFQPLGTTRLQSYEQRKNAWMHGFAEWRDPDYLIGMDTRRFHSFDGDSGDDRGFIAFFYGHPASAGVRSEQAHPGRAALLAAQTGEAWSGEDDLFA